MKFITATVLSLAAFSAFATELTPLPRYDGGPVRTRAEVRAERDAAIADGSFRPLGEAAFAWDYGQTMSERSRADVRRDLQTAIGRGESLFYGEAGPSVVVGQATTMHTADSAVARSSASVN